MELDYIYIYDITLKNIWCKLSLLYPPFVVSPSFTFHRIFIRNSPIDSESLDGFDRFFKKTSRVKTISSSICLYHSCNRFISA